MLSKCIIKVCLVFAKGDMGVLKQMDSDCWSRLKFMKVKIYISTLFTFLMSGSTTEALL